MSVARGGGVKDGAVAVAEGGLQGQEIAVYGGVAGAAGLEGVGAGDGGAGAGGG